MNAAPRPPLSIGIVHYQILGAAGLALVFLGQLDQAATHLMGGLVVVFAGLVGLATKWRIAPLLVMSAFAVTQIGSRFMLLQTFAFDEARPLLQPSDILIACGLVGYIAAHYRLQSLARAIIPVEARSRPPRRLGKRNQVDAAPSEKQRRAEALLTPAEIARFALFLPMWALAGQALWHVLANPWTPQQVFHMRLHRLIALTWLLVLGIIVIGTIVLHWRRRQMSGAEARMALQDTLWRETRREQRRIFRWLAWRRLHERADR